MFAASKSAAAAAGAANYIEDVFSTWLYTGNGSTQTITNGIDMSSNAGLVWIKGRSGATGHRFTDTARGATKYLSSNSTNQELTDSTGLTAFGTTGFTIGADTNYNNNAATYASWTFRKQAKFFDVVTYTGDGVAGRTVAHNLGSVPGCIIVKRTDTTGAWQVYHRSLANTEYLVLNTTAAKATGTTRWNSTTPTSTEFSLGTDATVNANGGTYVAYLFAHDAGGFGLTGTDNVISCGSFVGTGGNQTISLGYEPQFLILKNASAVTNWFMQDNMRGFNVGGSQQLYPNDSFAESNSANPKLTATGFQHALTAGNTGIYIAIRRGPMKTPTSGTSVFSPITANAVAGTTQTTSFAVDSQWKAKRASDTLNISVDDRLRGASTTNTASGNYLITSGSAAEATTNATTQAWNNVGFQISTYYASASDVFWNFRRAPGFMDVVCYTGTGTNRTVTHNLGVAPELIIVKSRGSAVNWAVYSATTGAGNVMYLNTTAASFAGATFWNSTAPTSSVFSVGTSTATNASADTYVAYLFASCPGVSKVGSYSGTGATQTISCGFAARFVLIKRTNSTGGDWFVWDTARGMVAGTDPRLGLNLSTAETNANWVYTDASGFQIVTTDPIVNASGGTYLYLAIA